MPHVYVNVVLQMFSSCILNPIKVGLDSHHEALSGVVCKNLQDDDEEFQKTNFIPGGLECDKSGCKDRAGRDKLDS